MTRYFVAAPDATREQIAAGGSMPESKARAWANDWNAKHPTLPVVLYRLAADQKTVAERQWSAPTKAKVAQKACDVGLFSDDRDQLDMVEMFQQPAED